MTTSAEATNGGGPVMQGIIPTWGTGTDKKTMALHIKRAIYSELGWKAGDFLIITPDYENNRIILEKLDIQKAKKGGGDKKEDEHKQHKPE